MKCKIFMSAVILCVLSSCVPASYVQNPSNLASWLLCSRADASITSHDVQAAWARISKADGFKTIPITYEKDDSPNAWVKFKSQNDFSVHVTKGLMKILDTEEQIAGVLGHEIGHVKLGHYDKGVGRAVGWTLLGIALGKAGGIAQTAGNVGIQLAESGFSRGQEVEADDYGTELLKRAGYDPYGLYRAMKAFQDNKYVTQPNGFNSHPPTARRLKHLMDKAKEVSSKNFNSETKSTARKSGTKSTAGRKSRTTKSTQDSSSGQK